MPQWRPAMWRGFRMPIEKGGRAANARERSLRQRHVRAAANGVGGNVAHPGKAIRRADEEGERRAFRSDRQRVLVRAHRGVRRARPARGIAHVDGALPAGREPGDGARRAARCSRTAATSRSRTRRPGASPPTPATAPSSTTCWSRACAATRRALPAPSSTSCAAARASSTRSWSGRRPALTRLTDCLSIVLAPSVLNAAHQAALAHIAVRRTARSWCWSPRTARCSTARWTSPRRWSPTSLARVQAFRGRRVHGQVAPGGRGRPGAQGMAEAFRDPLVRMALDEVLSCLQEGELCARAPAWRELASDQARVQPAAARCCPSCRCSRTTRCCCTSSTTPLGTRRGAPSVRIGRENDAAELSGVSVVASRYGRGASAGRGGGHRAHAHGLFARSSGRCAPRARRSQDV